MNGITSLNAGAPDLRLTGDQRPQEDNLVTDFDQPLQQEGNIREKIKQIAEQSGHPESFPATDSDFAALAQLSDSPDDFPSTDYDFEVILRIAKEPGYSTPEQSKAETYANYMAQGGRIGLKGGQLVQPGPGRPGYNGGDPVGGYGSQGEWGGGNQGNYAPVASSLHAPAPVESKVSPAQSIAMTGGIGLAGKTQSEAENTMAAEERMARASTAKIESVIGAPSGLSDVTPAQADLLAGVKTGDASEYERIMGLGDYPVYEGTEDTEGQAEVDLAFAINKGLLQKDPTTGDIVEGRNVRDLETGEIVPREEPTITQGGEGEGSIVTDTTQTIPLTIEDTGLTAEEDAAAVAALDYGQTFPTEFQGVPHPEYGLGAFTPTVTAPQVSFEAPGAARGGRIPAA